MSGSPLKKFVLTPVVVSAAVFAAMTLPLAIFGSKPVTIQLQQEPVFQGQLRDVATPYLGLATALSLGAGVASIAVTGWRISTRKSSQAEAQLLDLTQNLKQKEELLEALQLSESRLEASGLSAFVDEEVPLQQALQPPVTSQSANPVLEPLVITAQPIEAQPVAVSGVTVQAAAAKFACAQNFLGYAQAKTLVQPIPQETSLASLEVEQLHTQLQQIMAQMASVQTALSATQSAVTSSAQVPRSPARLQVIKSWSAHHKIS
jgi:hypothetical protein